MPKRKAPKIYLGYIKRLKLEFHSLLSNIICYSCACGSCEPSNQCQIRFLKKSPILQHKSDPDSTSLIVMIMEISKSTFWIYLWAYYILCTATKNFAVWNAQTLLKTTILLPFFVPWEKKICTIAWGIFREPNFAWIDAVACPLL